MTWIAVCGHVGLASHELVRNLLAIYPKAYGAVLPTTTALLLPGEANGESRYCVSKTEFLGFLAAETVVGHWIIGGRHTGITLRSILDVEDQGFVPIVLIDGYELTRLRALAEKNGRSVIAVWVESCPEVFVATLERQHFPIHSNLKRSIAQTFKDQNAHLVASDWLWQLPLDYDKLLAAYEVDERIEAFMQPIAALRA